MEQVNGEPAVHVFTDEIHACRFAIANKVLNTAGDVAILTKPILEALDQIAELGRTVGVIRAVFNGGDHAFVCRVADVPLLRQRILEANSPMGGADAPRPGENDSAKLERWHSVLSMDSWHFVDRGSIETNNVKPFIANHEGKGFLMAFSDEKKAHAFAVKNGLCVENSDSYGILSVKMPNAVSYAASLATMGVHGVIFDDGPDGLVLPLSQLRPLAERIGVSLPETAKLA